MIFIVDVALDSKKSSTLCTSLFTWLSGTRGTAHSTNQATELNCWGQPVGGGAVGAFQKKRGEKREKRHKLNEMSGRSQKKALPKTVSLTRHLHKTFEINCASLSQKRFCLKTMGHLPWARFSYMIFVH